jgi:hypothetical protein
MTTAGHHAPSLASLIDDNTNAEVENKKSTLLLLWEQMNAPCFDGTPSFSEAEEGTIIIRINRRDHHY